jgi:hypothetical protein
MNARTALTAVEDLLADYASFAESFDHQQHGDDEGVRETGEDWDDSMCRFEQYDILEALQVLQRLVRAAQRASWELTVPVERVTAVVLAYEGEDAR